MTIDRTVLNAALWDQLATVSGATKWAGEPTLPLPLVPGSDGRVAPYLVFWPSFGTPSDEQNLNDTSVDVDWLIQVTCAAGTDDAVAALATRVDAALYRWVPVINGLVCGPMKPPSGYDPGPIRLDRNVNPHRPFLPLQYRSIITAT